MRLQTRRSFKASLLPAHQLRLRVAFSLDRTLEREEETIEGEHTGLLAATSFEMALIGKLPEGLSINRWQHWLNRSSGPRPLDE